MTTLEELMAHESECRTEVERLRANKDDTIEGQAILAQWVNNWLLSKMMFILKDNLGWIDTHIQEIKSDIIGSRSSRQP